MKELIKLLLIVTISLGLTSCWLKKCEKPDAEHCSWTMVPEGRTVPFIFSEKSGKKQNTQIYQPTYGNDQPNGSTSSCTGAHYSSQMDIGVETLYWSVDRDNSGNHSFQILNYNYQSATIRISQDSMIATFPSQIGKKYRLSKCLIIKNKGIQTVTVNDTIYERIN